MKPNTVYNARARCIGDVNFGKSIAARTGIFLFLVNENSKIELLA